MSDKPDMQTVGRYQLLERVEEGPTASAFRATDTASGQKVILRLLSVPASANQQIRDFMESLRDPYSDRRIQDPSVLRLVDVGMHERRYFVVHEDFGGMALDRFLAERKPDIREKLRLARCIAESLRAVHAYKAVHGDVKPANILLSTRTAGRTLVKLALTDLGQATGDGMVSVYGELLGTPKYMAPEQIAGRRATPASDIFALGVVFYEMFGGSEPFRGSSPLGYLQANREAVATPLREVDSRIPVEVSRIVERMLAREPRQRYRVVQSLLDDLDRAEAILDGASPEPAAPGTDSVFAEDVRQTACGVGAWRTVALLSLVAAAILFAAVVFMMRDGAVPPEPGPEARRPADAAPRIPPPPPTDRAGNNAGEEDAVAPAPTDESFAAVLTEARHLRGSGRHPEALALLRAFQARNRNPRIAEALKQEIAGVRFAAAEALFGKRDLVVCADAYREIIRDYPNTQWSGMGFERLGEALLLKAEQHEKRGELAEAVRTLETLIKECPNSAAAQKAQRVLPAWRVRLANALTGPDPNKAVETLTRVPPSKDDEIASATTETRAQALFARGNERAEAGLWEQAIEDYRAAHAADPKLAYQVKPKEAEAMAQRALELKEQGDLAASLKVWEALHRKYPESLGYQRAKPKMSDLVVVAGQLGKDRQNNAVLLWAMAENARKQDDVNTRWALLERLIREYPGADTTKLARQQLAERDLTAANASLREGRLEETRERLATLAKAYPNTPAGTFAAREVKRWDTCPEGMAYVPTGTFVFGLSAEDAARLVDRYSVPKIMSPQWFGPQQPERHVSLQGFYMDRTEVTNAEYKTFLDATGRSAPASSDWTADKVKPGFENNPVTNVSWQDASDYAKWAGKRLPTEWEWEKAARGLGGDLFPWGETFDPTRAVVATGGVTAGTRPVGSIRDARSPFGCYDMIGNVMEWTASDYGPYEGDQPAGLLFDREHKVARGCGHDESLAYFCLATSRFNLPPDTRSSALGFRCVKDAE